MSWYEVASRDSTSGWSYPAAQVVLLTWPIKILFLKFFRPSELQKLPCISSRCNLKVRNCLWAYSLRNFGYSAQPISHFTFPQDRQYVPSELKRIPSTAPSWPINEPTCLEGRFWGSSSAFSGGKLGPYSIWGRPHQSKFNLRRITQHSNSCVSQPASKLDDFFKVKGVMTRERSGSDERTRLSHGYFRGLVR